MMGAAHTEFPKANISPFDADEKVKNEIVQM